MSDPGSRQDDFELQAAELALGLLGPAERASALRRQIGDPAFAARVGQWRAQGDRWLETISPDVVEPKLWERISAEMTPQVGMASQLGTVGDAEDTVVAHAAPARSDAARSLPRWKAATFATSAACAAMVALFVSDGPQSSPAVDTGIPRELATTNIAQIADKSGNPLVSAVFSPDTGTLTLRVAQFDSAERVPELWVIPQGGKPYSLGLVAGGSRVSVNLSDELRQYLVDGSTIAVTLELPTGAPHKTPSGAILGTASLATI